MIMKNEIKEILNKLKDKNNYISHSMILLSIKETAAILDCITNLQQIEQDHQRINGELREELEDYKSRNEKAIKYIVKNMCQTIDTGKEYFDNYSPCTDLLNILQGDDKE